MQYTTTNPNQSEIYPHAIDQAIQELYRTIPDKQQDGTIDLNAWEKLDPDHDIPEVLDVAREMSSEMRHRIQQLNPPTQPADSIPTGSSNSPLEGGSRGVLSHTKLGTPCSPKWDQDWIELVDQTEQEVGHRCCGAHAPDEAPCQLQSTSKNGRCRFHGGGLNSGAQKGNSNARIHGLYARRIQQCGQHCPQWETCPYAGDDIKSLPQTNRPNCYFEEQELNSLRQLDATAHETYKPLHQRDIQELNKTPYPMYAQLLSLRENLHMLQIMITRAAKALSTKGLTTQSTQQTDTYYATHEKPSALLQAHQILTREHRLTLGTYERFIKQWGTPKYERV